MAYMISHMLLY